MFLKPLFSLEFQRVMIALIFLCILIKTYGEYEELRRMKKIYNKNDIDKKFEEIYRKLNIGNVEYTRKKLILENSIMLILITIILISIIIFLKFHYTAIFMSVSLLFFIIMGEVPSRIRDNEQKYEIQYKNTVILNFVNLYDEKFKYKNVVTKEKRMELKNDMEKFFGKAGVVALENYIEGIIKDDVKMNLYDLSIEPSFKWEDVDSKATGYTTSKNLIKCTYTVIDINKKATTTVRITPNKLLKRKNKVELESSEFEKYFDVNSEDRILATRILTADVMEILVDFYQKYNFAFEIVIEEDKIHTNIHTDLGFKIPLYKSVTKEFIYFYYTVLEFTINLSKEINRALNGIEL